MKREQYDALVKRVEAYAAAHPAAYAMRVVLLAALGYVYAGLMLLVAFAVVAGVSWLTFRASHSQFSPLLMTIAVLGATLLVTGRVLWVRFPAPGGVRLRAGDGPGLVALVHMLTARLRTPRLHRILITTVGNVGVVQRPRLGPFGWYRNYLLLGLPLMQTLSPEEFRAALVHELGHLSRQHGRFGSWIYRIRVMWLRLGAQPQGGHGGLATQWFLTRWAPYFNAYTLVLARRQEYDADQFAAQLAGKNVLARGLARMEVMGSYLQQRWWPAVLARAQIDPEPPTGVMGSLAVALRAGPTPSDERRWLEQALRRRTDHGDTHPSLSDRLAALRVSAQPALALGREGGSLSAAEFHFGETLPELQSRLGALWAREVRSAWQRRHQLAAQAQQRLAELATAASERPLTPGEEWEQAQLELDLNGAEGALPRLRALVERAPDHHQARYALGSVLLEGDDPSGVQHIAWVCEREPAARVSGYELVSRFYERHGREREAEEYQRRAWAAADLWELALAERRGVDARDRLLPHALTPEEVRGLRQQLEQIPLLKAAYIARKDVRHIAEQPYYVVAVELRLRSYWAHAPAQRRQLIGPALQALPLRGPWCLFCGRLDSRHVWAKIKQVPGAELLRR